MENLSVLKLFSSAVKTEATKAASDTLNTYTSKAKELESGFEDVFKSYLDKTETAVSTARKALTGQDTQTTSENSEVSETVKSVINSAKKAASAETSNTSETETTAETPEEVIEGLNLSEEVKVELMALLESIKTSEDAEEFMDQLMAAMVAAQMTVEQAETALTELATTLLDGTSELLSEKSSPVLLEQVLDNISDVLEQEAEPTELFVIPEPKEQQTATVTLITEGQKQLQNQQTASAQLSTGTSETATQVKQETKIETVELEEVDTEEVVTAAVDDATEEAVMDFTDDDSGADNTSDTNQNFFNARTQLTEKVITTEIKIEKPSDILKFAELVEIAKNQNASKITVQLNPVELGKVNIELTEQAGKISGKVTFESESAKNLFASNIDSFKQQMAEKGIIVDNLEFLFKDFEHHEFAGWEDQKNKSGSGNGGGSEELSADSETDAPEEDDAAVYA